MEDKDPTGNNICRIGAVMVLYHPDWELTSEAIKSLASQVEVLCIMDNTPGADLTGRFAAMGNIRYFPMGDNIGIAAAQNRGIEYLQQRNFDFVVFSDQDSKATGGLIENLCNDYFLLREKGYDVGIIGPAPVNRKTGKVYENGKKFIREIDIDSRHFTECENIISSFSLVPLELFRRIGTYREELFIDFVETEWCFRLIHHTGLAPFMSRRLTISHEAGRSSHFMGKQINVSSPFRLYYQIRNYFWLRRLPHTTRAWKEQTGGKLWLKLAYYPIVPRKRLSYLSSIVRALRDGICRNPFKTQTGAASGGAQI